jgi:uncharacterized protein YndB with AHSA1/START domain
VEIETSTDIEAPPSVVWPYLVDWEHLDRWMTEASGFRVLSSIREGVGVEAEATIKIAGITTVDPVEVTRWEPPEVLEIRHLGWVGGSGLMRCTETAKGTRLCWVETLWPPLGPLGALGFRIFKPLMRMIFTRDLRQLKLIVEFESDPPVVH